MKIALVHDDMVQEGGAEKLFWEIAKIFPEAPIYTSIIDWKQLPEAIDSQRIRASWMQKIPLKKLFYKLLLPFYPLAFEGFSFDKYDLAISSTTRFAKSIITKPKTVHVCYINSLPRFLWDENAASSYWPLAFRGLFKFYINWLKRWDRVASLRVDYYIANSKNVAFGIRKIYGVESEVVYPIADCDFFRLAKIHRWKLRSEDYFLVVTRLVKWKKVEIAILAAHDLGINLKIVGDGPDRKRLEGVASNSDKGSEGKKIDFLGKVDPGELKILYQNAKALIVTQEEDFGIAAVEAQACGAGVIGFASGGLMEIVAEGKTGVLYKRQSAASLKDAIVRFDGLKWNVSTIRKNALRFSKAKFVRGFSEAITKILEDGDKK